MFVQIIVFCIGKCTAKRKEKKLLGERKLQAKDEVLEVHCSDWNYFNLPRANLSGILLTSLLTYY